jgi:hypothetical protein
MRAAAQYCRLPTHGDVVARVPQESALGPDGYLTSGPSAFLPAINSSNARKFCRRDRQESRDISPASSQSAFFHLSRFKVFLMARNEIHSMQQEKTLALFPFLAKRAKRLCCLRRLCGKKTAANRKTGNLKQNYFAFFTNVIVWL